MMHIFTIYLADVMFFTAGSMVAFSIVGRHQFRGKQFIVCGVLGTLELVAAVVIQILQ